MPEVQFRQEFNIVNMGISPEDTCFCLLIGDEIQGGLLDPQLPLDKVAALKVVFSMCI